MPARKSKTNAPTPVDAITHADKRANLPTADPRAGLRHPGDRTARCQSATRATRRSTRSSSGRARTSSTARTSSPTHRPSTSRRRSTRGSSSRTCAARPQRPEDEPELTLFDTFDGLDELDLVDFYRHQANWSNRMILGDSLNVMASLAEREGAARQSPDDLHRPAVRHQVRQQLAGVGTQARRQGRQARGRIPRGRADQGLP